MLDPAAGLPAGVIGLTANGTVIAQDLAQALLLAKAGPAAASGFILFVDPDLDGYLAEIVSALETAAAVQPPQYRRWALVVPDAAVSEAEQYKGGGEPTVFPCSRRQEAISWASGE